MSKTEHQIMQQPSEITIWTKERDCDAQAAKLTVPPRVRNTLAHMRERIDGSTRRVTSPVPPWRFQLVTEGTPRAHRKLARLAMRPGERKTHGREHAINAEAQLARPDNHDDARSIPHTVHNLPEQRGKRIIES